MAPQPDKFESDVTLPKQASVVVIGGGIIGVSAALELAERLRKITENLEVKFDDKIIKITTSAGVVSYKNGQNKDSLIQKADELLYEAKKQGRNIIKPGLRLCQKNTGSL